MPAKNITQIRTDLQTSEENQPVKPWERQKSEPANWYMRFRRYLDLGPGRSLRKALDQEPATKGNKVQKKEGVTLSVPGSWSRASKVWRWQERAQAYDLEKQEIHAQEMREIASKTYYASKAARIMELNNLAQILKNNLKNANDFDTLLKLTSRMQSVFQDIEVLMVGMGESFAQIADASARKNYIDDLAAQIKESIAKADNPKQALENTRKQLLSL